MTGKVLETIYGKRHKSEIREVSSCLRMQFPIFRDDTRWKGGYETVARALEIVRETDR